MFKKLTSSTIIFCFFLTTLGPAPQAHGSTGLTTGADSVLGLPAPGTMVSLSPSFEPALIKGLTVHKDNPFLFDFIVDPGQDASSVIARSEATKQSLKAQADRMIKYFFAALTIPDKDIWVNLSPYEKDRMIPVSLGQTAMGRDLLAQDYMLKQLTASLIYPQKALGKTFWQKVYSKAKEMYGTTQVPVNTFNKVWIVPQKAGIYEHGQTAFIVSGHLKVMLEEDYLALTKHNAIAKNMSFPNASVGNPDTKDVNQLGSQIIRQIILPEIEKEINEGKNFATLRQIFYAQVLAVWFKRNLKQALLNQVYANKGIVKGIERVIASAAKQSQQDLSPEQIYHQYLRAYKKGVFNFIQEDPIMSSPNTNGLSSPNASIGDPGHATIARKYFSGGYANLDQLSIDSAQLSVEAMASIKERDVDFAVLAVRPEEVDAAMRGYTRQEIRQINTILHFLIGHRIDAKDEVEAKAKLTQQVASFNSRFGSRIQSMVSVRATRNPKKWQIIKSNFAMTTVNTSVNTILSTQDIQGQYNRILVNLNGNWINVRFLWKTRKSLFALLVKLTNMNAKRTKLYRDVFRTFNSVVSAIDDANRAMATEGTKKDIQKNAAMALTSSAAYFVNLGLPIFASNNPHVIIIDGQSIDLRQPQTFNQAFDREVQAVGTLDPKDMSPEDNAMLGELLTPFNVILGVHFAGIAALSAAIVKSTHEFNKGKNAATMEEKREYYKRFRKDWMHIAGAATIVVTGIILGAVHGINIDSIKLDLLGILTGSKIGGGIFGFEKMADELVAASNAANDINDPKLKSVENFKGNSPREFFFKYTDWPVMIALFIIAYTKFPASWNPVILHHVIDFVNKVPHLAWVLPIVPVLMGVGIGATLATKVDKNRLGKDAAMTVTKLERRAILISLAAGTAAGVATAGWRIPSFIQMVEWFKSFERRATPNNAEQPDEAPTKTFNKYNDFVDAVNQGLIKRDTKITKYEDSYGDKYIGKFNLLGEDGFFMTTLDGHVWFFPAQDFGKIGVKFNSAMTASSAANLSLALQRIVNVKEFPAGAVNIKNPGGIDLSQQDAALRVEKDANGGVKVNVDPALIARIEREGMSEVVPVIINMRPADIRSLFGVETSI